MNWWERLRNEPLSNDVHWEVSNAGDRSSYRLDIAVDEGDGDVGVLEVRRFTGPASRRQLLADVARNASLLAEDTGLEVSASSRLSRRQWAVAYDVEDEDGKSRLFYAWAEPGGIVLFASDDHLSRSRDRSLDWVKSVAVYQSPPVQEM